MILDSNLTNQADKYRQEGKEFYFLQPRSSMMGKSESEIYQYFTTQTEMADDSLPMLSAKAGTALHRLVQAQQYDEGRITTAEKFVHNKDHNFTGHIDAISSGLGIGDIKTVSRGMFDRILKNGPKESHITQVNSYMNTTGTHHGYIQYVMREDPSKQVVFKVEYSGERFDHDMAKVRRVQERVMRELSEGKLKWNNLRQGDHAEVLAEKNKEAHGHLKADTRKTETLIDEFLYNQHKLNKVTGEERKIRQSISMARQQSNSPLNPFGRREDRNTIEGMPHGWFGSQRNEHTAFGSQRVPQELMPIMPTNEEMEKYFRNQIGIDIETHGLSRRKDNIVQVGINFGNEFYEVNRADAGVAEELMSSPFHQGTHIAEQIDVFQETRRRKKVKRSGFEYHTESLVRKDFEGTVRDLFGASNKLNRNYVLFNGNFEVDEFNQFFGKGMTKEYGIEYSERYIQLAKERGQRDRMDLLKLQDKQITEEMFLRSKVKRQVDFYNEIIKNGMKETPTVLEGREFVKTLNALAQFQGYLPKTGSFDMGTNVDFLSQAFYRTAEKHSSVFDIRDQNKLVPQVIDLINKVAKGDTNLTKGEKRFFDDWNNNTEKIFRDSYEKKIHRAITEGVPVEEIYRPQLLNIGGISEEKLFSQALENVKATGVEPINKVYGKQTAKTKGLGVKVGAGVLATAAIANALSNQFRFSGRDDEANTVEGLYHTGLAKEMRKATTDFGSGYQIDKYHSSEVHDPTENHYLAATFGLGATVGAAKLAWGVETNVRLNDLTYLGEIVPGQTVEQTLGRTNATLGDIALAGIKRAESSLGGLPKVFGISEILGSGTYNSAEVTWDLTQEGYESFAKYMDGMTKRQLLEEGATSIVFKNKQLYIHKADGTRELLEGVYDLQRTSHDLKLSSSMAQQARAQMRRFGVDSVDPSLINFIPVGGTGVNNRHAQKVNTFATETFAKYLGLMDDPLEAFRELFPDVEIGGKRAQEILKKTMPQFGVGGSQNLQGSLWQLITRHRNRLAGMGALGALTLGTADWAIKAIAPEDTMLDSAGLVGVGAETLKTGHLAYSRISEAAGLTGLRSAIEEKAPDSAGWQTAIGFGASGGFIGLGYELAQSVRDEAFSPEKYKQFLRNKLDKVRMPEPLNKIPGFKGEYSRLSRAGRIGGLAGLALGLPFLVSGLGSSQSTAEWEKEYSGEKEVAVKKGRYWEASMTPWEGGKTMYYRPNWYASMKDAASREVLHDGENISPIGHLIRDLWDPYWLEKKMWDESPYPYTGPDGSSMGLFGVPYELTIGRALKAPALMHKEELNRAHEGGPEAVQGNSFGSLFQKQWNSLTEAMGLRGFFASNIKEDITGESSFNTYNPRIASASGMGSFNSAFYDANLGGGVLTTEALRRLLPKEEKGSYQELNPLRNAMPDWMPGKGFHTNFKEGDPYSKIAEGYYRLPGRGYATRYKELEGLDPNEYPDIFKYKILADVAYGSNEFKTLRGQLQNRDLTAKEYDMFTEVERQLKERNESNLKLRDPAMYDSLLGRYTALLTDVARQNPLEQATPFAPARKFLPGTDAVTRYEESIYGDDFKDWGDPIGDFVIPAIRSTANVFGVADVNEQLQYNRSLEDHFDKLEHAKQMKLAREADLRGDGAAARMHRIAADKTMSGLDPYADSNTVLSAIPQRERPYFEKFLKASADDRERILELAPQQMKDIYVAQWDKQNLEAIQSGAAGIDDRRERMRLSAEIKNRTEQMRARRKEANREFLRDHAPADDWAGWNKNVSMDDVKMKYLVNEGQDYHYYGMWKDRLNRLSRKPYLEQAARDVNFSSEGYTDKYSEAMSRASEAGIQDPRVIMLPGLEQGTNLQVQLLKQDEQREQLRGLGYVL